MIESEYKPQIERALGRALRPEELVRVDALDGLTRAERVVAEALARKQLVLCAHYLRTIAPIGAGEASRFIDELLTSSEPNEEAKTDFYGRSVAIDAAVAPRRAPRWPLAAGGLALAVGALFFIAGLSRGDGSHDADLAKSVKSLEVENARLEKSIALLTHERDATLATQQQTLAELTSTQHALATTSTLSKQLEKQVADIDQVVAERYPNAPKDAAWTMLMRDLNRQPPTLTAAGLSPGQLQELTKRLDLRSAMSATVRIIRVGSNSRAAQLFEQLRGAFANAGWTVDAQAIGKAVMEGPSMPRTSYLTSKVEGTAPEKLVANALSSAGLEIPEVENAWIGSGTSEPAVVVVLQ